MIALSLAEIADIVGGELHDAPDPTAVVTGYVEFDSRKIAPGGLFVALPGARVDGHNFAARAVDQGAVACLTARPVGVPSIVVPGGGDAVVTAMSELARVVVRRLSARGLTVIGITGSSGKTSTKDLVASVVRVAGEAVVPPGSFNNEIGHPYTALRCGPGTRYLVAEMSARNIGHIAHLARIAPPAIGVELNVGSAHLGEFGSRENIATAKAELVEALPESGVAILNADDPLVARMVEHTRARVVRFSAKGARGADVWASEISLDGLARASFILHIAGEEPRRVALRVFGAHQVSNALAAAAVGRAIGLGSEKIARALGQHEAASANRMDVRTRSDGVTVIDDSYNANPDSMRAGIAALAYTAAAHPEARAHAVLGEMSELGAETLAEHRTLGEELGRYRVDELIVVGESPACRALAEAAHCGGVHTVIVPDVDAAIRRLRRGLAERDTVLIKASHAAGLWRIADALVDPATDTLGEN